MPAVQEAPKTASSSQSIERFYAWTTFIAAAVILCGRAIVDIPTLLGGKEPYRVMGSFWVSGWAALHGQNPYDFYPLTWHFFTLPHDAGSVIYDVNLSPPAMMPLFEWMTRFSLRSDIIVWTILSTAMFLVGALLLFLRGELQKRQIVWLLLSTLVTNTIWFGQDYSLMFLMMCFAWICFETDRETTAAVLIGILIAMKPNFGLWPIMLLVAGYKKPAIVAAATAFGLSVYPLFVYGPSIYRQWLHADSLVNHHIFAGDMSFVGNFTRIGFPWVGVALAVAAAAWLLIFVRRTRPNQTNLAGIAICAGILCAPLAWQHYMLFAAPFFVARCWGKLETVAAVLIAMPILFEGPAMVAGPWYVAIVALPHLAGLYLMLWSFMRSS